MPLCLDAAVPALSVRDLPAQGARLRRGGVDAALVTVASVEPPALAVQALAEWWQAHDDPTQPIAVATDVAAVRRIAATGDVAVLLHLQGTDPLGGSLELLDAYRRLGVRVIQLTYNYACAAGDGCLEERDGGLTAFGRQALARMQALGIAVDLSHAGERTCLDALQITSAPLLATHANARAVCDSPRNLSDAVIDAIAATGGVIGACAFRAFVSDADAPTIDDVAAHIVHIAERVGPEHVGLGLDFADEDEADYDYYRYDERYYPRPPWTWPTGLSWWEDVGNLREVLRARGFSGPEVDGIMGENFLAALDRIWAAGPPG